MMTTTLEINIEQINSLTKNPMTRFKLNEKDESVPQVGHYYLDRAHGAFCLFQVTSEKGDIRNVFEVGYLQPVYVSMMVNGYLMAIQESFSFGVD